MKIYKFGGSSLDSKEKIKKICDQLKGEEDFALVVSAPGDTTNRILAYLNGADVEPLSLCEELADYIPPGSPKKWESVMEEFESLIKIRPKIGSARIDAAILATGERLSGLIMEGALCDEGIDATYLDFYEKHFPLVLDGNPLNAVINYKETRRRWKQLKSEDSLIFPGFGGIGKEGNVMLLGRGGSDTAAMAHGYGARAREIYLCTNIDGIKEAPPDIVKDSSTVPELSIEAARDAGYFDMKLPGSKTIEPLEKLNREGIEAKCIITHSMSISGNRTEIRKRCEKSYTLVGGRDVIESECTLLQDLIKLEEQQIDYAVVGGRGNLKVFLPSEHKPKVSYSGEYALIGAVSQEFEHQIGISSRLTAALRREGINILYNFDPSRISVGYVIEREDKQRGIKTLYRELIGQD